jgi:hypothetical protein
MNNIYFYINKNKYSKNILQYVYKVKNFKFTNTLDEFSVAKRLYRKQ